MIRKNVGPCERQILSPLYLDQTIMDQFAPNRPGRLCRGIADARKWTAVNCLKALILLQGRRGKLGLLAKGHDLLPVGGHIDDGLARPSTHDSDVVPVHHDGGVKAVLP